MAHTGNTIKVSLCIRPHTIAMYNKIKDIQVFASKAEIYQRAVDIGMQALLDNIEEPYNRGMAERNVTAIDILKEITVLLRENINALGHNSLLRGQGVEETDKSKETETIDTGRDGDALYPIYKPRETQ